MILGQSCFPPQSYPPQSRILHIIKMNVSGRADYEPHLTPELLVGGAVVDAADPELEEGRGAHDARLYVHIDGDLDRRQYVAEN